MKCRICHNEDNNSVFSTREMMFGFRDTFTYIECVLCGTVQISEIPSNIGKYYPSDYYSYTQNKSDSFSFKDWRKGKVFQYYYGKKTIIGFLLAAFSSKPPLWMKKDYFDLNHKILDVGSGSGKLLLEMKRGGFKYLTGADPFINANIQYESGVTIFKKAFTTIDEKFDCVMFHHSFEHMDNPEEIFKHLFNTLTDNGFALIRIPVADSFSYKKYHENWVNLDPPRHYYLHTDKSIEILAKKTGLKIMDKFRDANQFQFYGSELYKNNIPLEDYNKGLYPDYFSKSQIRAFRNEAKKLNKINEGDWACYYLRKNK
ncbi:methyltransferase family protein [Sediminibacterium goheungense]|uniref:Methyltransferase family protein n=2 Tax=Sediminibacterium goheungense TaxID=1086393 RepID=A0A4R6IUV8_9BACT|nr:methyltransferase family protein [Sediminibacterium goheungense]